MPEIPLEQPCYALHLSEHPYGSKGEEKRDVSPQRKWKLVVMWVIKEPLKEKKQRRERERERDAVRQLACIAYRLKFLCVKTLSFVITQDLFCSASWVDVSTRTLNMAKNGT